MPPRELVRRSFHISTSQQPGFPRHRHEILDQARTTVERSAALIAVQREALGALQTARATHLRLRGADNGNGNGNGAASSANGHSEQARANGDAILTARQLEILGYLADGLNTSQIAERLWLSRATVRNHVSGIFAGLECHSRLEAVAKARQLRLL